VDQWNDKGLHDRVLNPREFAGKRILIVGGGDSAFDWAVNLQGVAKSIVMIHRRDGFRDTRRPSIRCRRCRPPARCSAHVLELKEIAGSSRIERSHLQ